MYHGNSRSHNQQNLRSCDGSHLARWLLLSCEYSQNKHTTRKLLEIAAKMSVNNSMLVVVPEISLYIRLTVLSMGKYLQQRGSNQLWHAMSTATRHLVDERANSHNHSWQLTVSGNNAILPVPCDFFAAVPDASAIPRSSSLFLGGTTQQRQHTASAAY